MAHHPILQNQPKKNMQKRAQNYQLHQQHKRRHLVAKLL